MELDYLKTLPEGGFNFDMCIRNTAMACNSQMSTPVRTMKTGTTICGVIFKVNLTQFNTSIGWRCAGC